MRTKIFFILFLILNSYSYSQISQSVKDYVESLSEKYSKSTEFALEINSHFKNDTDKVAAIYYWMTNNIKLDEKEYFSEKRKYTYDFKYKSFEDKQLKIDKINLDLAEEAFGKRECDNLGYAYLYKKLCQNVGVECEVVSGTLKQDVKMIGRKPYKSDYLWNAVKLGKKYYLVDVMRGAGKVNILKGRYIHGSLDIYFMADPEMLFLTHFPKDKKWLLTDKTEEEFTNLPFFHPHYFESKLSLLEPWNGLINEVENNEFKIAFLDKRKKRGILKIRYAYHSDMLPRRPNFISPSSFGIPVKERQKDYVTILYENKPMVSYRLSLGN